MLTTFLVLHGLLLGSKRFHRCDILRRLVRRRLTCCQVKGGKALGGPRTSKIADVANSKQQSRFCGMLIYIKTIGPSEMLNEKWTEPSIQHRVFKNWKPVVTSVPAPPCPRPGSHLNVYIFALCELFLLQ